MSATALCHGQFFGVIDSPFIHLTSLNPTRTFLALTKLSLDPVTLQDRCLPGWDPAFPAAVSLCPIHSGPCSGGECRGFLLKGISLCPSWASQHSPAYFESKESDPCDPVLWLLSGFAQWGAPAGDLRGEAELRVIFSLTLYGVTVAWLRIPLLRTRASSLFIFLCSADFWLLKIRRCNAFPLLTFKA